MYFLPLFVLFGSAYALLERWQVARAMTALQACTILVAHRCALLRHERTRAPGGRS
jgi:hypothetical protein